MLTEYDKLLERCEYAESKCNQLQEELDLALIMLEKIREIFENDR